MMLLLSTKNKKSSTVLEIIMYIRSAHSAKV